MSRADEAASIDLPGADQLVLYGFSAPEDVRGAIVRLHPTQRRRWTARPPAGDAPDAFVSMTLQAGAIVADTWQGQRVHIDMETGAILGSAFVK